MIFFQIVCGLWAVAVIVAVAKHCLHPYEAAKEWLAVTGGYAALAVWVACGAPIAVHPAMALAALTLCTWWVCCAAWSERPDIGWHLVARNVAIVGAAIAGAGTDLVIGAMAIAGCLDTAYCFGRHWRGWRWFGERADQHHALGLQGNPNFFGTCQLVLFFAALHLCTLSLYWLPAAVLLLAGVVRSRCRSAWVGLVAGIGFAVISGLAGPVTALLLILGSGLGVAGLAKRKMLDKTKLFDKSSLRLRLSIWQAVWPIVRKHWLIGIGPDNLKLATPYLVRAARQAGIPFPENFSFRKAHSDYLQLWCDYGLFGLLGWVSMVATALYLGIVADMPGLVAAIVAVAVAGLFFHGQFLPSVFLPTALIVGRLLSAGPPAPIDPIATAVLVCAGVPVAGGFCLIATRRLLFRRKLYACLDPSGACDPGKALAWEKHSTMGNMMMADSAATRGHLFFAYLFAHRAYEHFDGEMKLADVVRRLAACYLVAHANGAGQKLAMAWKGEADSFTGKPPETPPPVEQAKA